MVVDVPDGPDDVGDVDSDEVAALDGSVVVDGFAEADDFDVEDFDVVA